MLGQVTSPLSERARSLIEQARDAHEPSASNRARVQWRVELSLASQPPQRRSGVHRWVAWWIAGAGMALASSAAALFWQGGPVHDSAEVLSVPPPEVTKTPLPAAQTSPSEEEKDKSTQTENGSFKTEQGNAPPRTGVPRTRESSARPRARRKASSAPAQNSLGAETQAIAQAQTALSRGEPKAALRILQRYDQQHRNGVLTEERTAARVLALCATGQKEAARAEAKRFIARWPRSPQIARLKISCAKSIAH